MKTPFPGMDPYLEHPVLWESVHARLITAIADQLQPALDPRYVASVEERVIVEGQKQRLPDVWIQQVEGEERPATLPETQADTAIILEVDDLEVRQRRVEILDSYNAMNLVALIEVVSPSNKVAGPGRQSYRAKQRETLTRECHLIEIDLLRRGRHTLCVPRWRLEEIRPYDYLACVNRWPRRQRFELYLRGLRDRLPRIGIPLVAPDADVSLDLQAALEHVYWNGRYMKRVRYHEPCVPRLRSADQRWANECWTTYQAARADLFPGPMT